MTETMRPIPVYPPEALTDEVRAKIVAAKQSLNTPILAQFAKGVPGSDRVLALGTDPHFACDYARVNNIDGPGLAAAVAYVLHLNDDPRAQTVVGWLSNTLGAEVKEVTTDAEGQTAVVHDSGRDAGGQPGPVGGGPGVGGLGAGTGPDDADQQHSDRGDVGERGDPGPRGPIDPNSYSEGNYRIAIRAAGEG